MKKPKKRNWLVEDNLVALYIAKHKYKDLNVKGGAKPRRVYRRRETAALPDNFCENGRIFAVA